MYPPQILLHWVITSIIVVTGLSLSILKSAAQIPDSCLTLNIPEFEGKLNPDSIKVNTCSNLSFNESLYARKGWSILFYQPVLHLPAGWQDSAVQLGLSDIDTAYSLLRDSFEVLQQRVGTFHLIPSVTGTGSQFAALIFDNYAPIGEVIRFLQSLTQTRFRYEYRVFAPAHVPNDKGLKPNTPWDSMLFSGTNNFWPRNFHLLGWQWNLYRQQLPLAWEITSGRRDIVIAATDLFDSTSSNHPDLGHFRRVTSDIIGDGTMTSYPLSFGHGLGVLSHAIATGNNDTSAGRGMVGTCPECSGLALFDNNCSDVDLDSSNNNHYEHIAVWNLSLTSGHVDSLYKQGGWSRHYADSIFHATLDAGIVMVTAALNDVSNRDYGRKYSTLIENGDTIIVWGHVASYYGGNVEIDSVNPTKEVKAICVGTTFDGRLSNKKCEVWNDSTRGVGGANYSGDGDVFATQYNFGQGTQKFDDSTDIPTRQLRKALACMDIVSATGTLSAIDGPDGSDNWMWKYIAEATGTSNAAPQVAGIAGLMLSINRYLGVNVQRDSNGKVFGASDVQRRAYNILTFTADKLNDTTTIDSGTHYKLKETAPGVIDTTEIYRYLRQNPDGSPIQYEYKLQSKDNLKRSWAQRMGFGRVNAYRAVAHAIRCKGDYAYSTSDTLVITDSLSVNENGSNLMHFGSWRSQGVKVLDSGGVAMPGGDTLHRNLGVTNVNGNGTTLTVPDNLILAIDGIVTTDNRTANNTIRTIGSGKILIAGYLDDVEIIGRTRIGDLVINSSDTNTVGCVAIGQTGITSEIYGRVTLKNLGVLLINRGIMKMYPGGRIDVAGSKNLTITDGATLEMGYGTTIKANFPRKVVVDSGSTLHVSPRSFVDLNIEVHVLRGGKLLIDTGAVVAIKQFRIDGGGELVARPGSRIILTQTTATNYCYGRLDIRGTSSARVSVSGNIAPCCEAECTTVIARGRIFVNDTTQLLSDRTSCNVRIEYTDFSEVTITASGAPWYPITYSSFKGSRSILNSTQLPLLVVNGRSALLNLPYNPPIYYPRREDLRLIGCTFRDMDAALPADTTARYKLNGIHAYQLKRVSVEGCSFGRLYTGVDVNLCDSTGVTSCTMDTSNFGVWAKNGSLWYCNNTTHLTEFGIHTVTAPVARGFSNKIYVSRKGVDANPGGFHMLRGNRFEDFNTEAVSIRGVPVLMNYRTVRKGTTSTTWEALGRNKDTVTTAVNPYGPGPIRADIHIYDPAGRVEIGCGFNEFAQRTTWHLVSDVPKLINVHNNKFRDSVQGHAVRRNNLVTVQGTPINTAATQNGCTILTSTDACSSTIPDPPWDKDLNLVYVNDGSWIGLASAALYFDTAYQVNRTWMFDTSFNSISRRIAMFGAYEAGVLGDSTEPKLLALISDLDSIANDTTDVNDVRSGAVLVQAVAYERLGEDSLAAAAYIRIVSLFPTSADSIAANWGRLFVSANGFDPDSQESAYDSAMAVYYDRVLLDLRRAPDTTLAKPVRSPLPEVSPVITGTKVILGQNVPNPFDRTTTIPFILPEQADVHLFVTDVQGRTVAEVLSGLQTAGRHEVNFDPGNLPGGVYFYCLEVKGTIQTRSMTITPQ